MQAAIRDPDPVVFLENELLYNTEFDMTEEMLSPDYVLPLDKAKVERAGTDVTIVTFSKMVGWALEAADNLAAQGVSAEVINLRSLKIEHESKIN